jgi:hypothetical protein
MERPGWKMRAMAEMLVNDNLKQGRINQAKATLQHEMNLAAFRRAYGKKGGGAKEVAQRYTAKTRRRHGIGVRPQKQWPPRICANAKCGHQFTPTDGRQHYCCPTCRIAASNARMRAKEKAASAAGRKEVTS